MLFKNNKLKTLVEFSSQFSLLYNAGLGFRESLILLKPHFKTSKLQHHIQRMIKHLESGHSFAEALSTCPDLFEPFYLTMLRVGEETGQLSKVLLILNKHYQEKIAFRSAVSQALYYPGLVMLLMLTISFGFCFAIVPRFELVLKHFHASLPFATRVLFSSVNLLQQHGLAVLMFFIVIMALGVMACKHFYTIGIHNVRIFKIPGIGPFYHYCILLRFCQVASLALQAGLSTEATFQLMRQLFIRTPFKNLIPLLLYDLKHGKRLTQLFQRKQYFPELCVSLMSVAETTGQLDHQFLKLAEVFKAEVDANLIRFKLSVEPIMMLLTGIVVGSMVLAIYYPIFSLGNAF